jgi:hypothetical protein
MAGRTEICGELDHDSDIKKAPSGDTLAGEFCVLPEHPFPDTLFFFYEGKSSR